MTTEGLIYSCDVVECRDEAFYFPHSVSDGYVCEGVADVSQFHLYVVFVSEQVIDFYSGESDVEGEDCEFCLVEVVDGISVYEFGAVCVVSSYLGYLVSCVLGHLHDVFKRFFPSQCEVSP